tara:strand:+ start:657 stop:2318 length:1662 start_codon:yes stop_codon:yes gene_type:complete
LKYIGQTLEKHKGCDILDINPGAGLWSQKLHEFLQPRSHVLLEPNPSLFKEFLDPLLDAPGSTYKLVSKDTSELSAIKEIVDEGHFANQQRVDPSDPKAQEPNHTLLVTGSLAWDPRLPGLGFDSMAKQLYHHFASAAWSNDLIHAFGPVRTLFWVENDDFNHMIAQSTLGMTKSSRMLEMTQQLEWVVGAERKARPSGKGALGREPQYELESIVRALRAGRESGLDMPPHRQDYTHRFASQIEEVSGGTGISRVDFIQRFMYDQQLKGNAPIGLAQQSAIEYIEMEMQVRKDHPVIDRLGVTFPTLESRQRRIEASSKSLPSLPTAFLRKRNQWVHNIKQRMKLEAVADIGEKLYKLECSALEMQHGSKRDALIEQIEKLDESWRWPAPKLHIRGQTMPLAEVDDRISLRYPPHPRIQWDQRSFEPLVPRLVEAWPHNRMSLVSATPIPRPSDHTSDLHEWMQDFVNRLYIDSAKPVLQALDNMQHGLSDIVNECPSFHDPMKGGRMLLKHLRVRMLTMDMIRELVQAYRGWPFKKPGSDHSTYFRYRDTNQ